MDSLKRRKIESKTWPIIHSSLLLGSRSFFVAWYFTVGWRSPRYTSNALGKFNISKIEKEVVVPHFTSFRWASRIRSLDIFLAINQVFELQSFCKGFIHFWLDFLWFCWKVSASFEMKISIHGDHICFQFNIFPFLRFALKYWFWQSKIWLYSFN